MLHADAKPLNFKDFSPKVPICTLQKYVYFFKLVVYVDKNFLFEC